MLDLPQSVGQVCRAPLGLYATPPACRVSCICNVQQTRYPNLRRPLHYSMINYTTCPEISCGWLSGSSISSRTVFLPCWSKPGWNLRSSSPTCSVYAVSRLVQTLIICHHQMFSCVPHHRQQPPGRITRLRTNAQPVLRACPVELYILVFPAAFAVEGGFGDGVVSA